MSHNLVGHPLFTLEAIGDLAGRMDPADLEHNAALDLPMGISNADLPSNQLSTAETIRTIANNGSWVLLKKIQQIPAYRDILDKALAELNGDIVDRTGAPMRPDAYLFISSPNAVTPLHFDPDYNILVQIRGSKTMTLFPVDDREMVVQQFQERYFSGGSRNLPWEERFGERGRPIDLQPGDAIYVPILAPHHVKVHSEYSISLSLTWRSIWSHHHADACRFNKRLRGLGLRPARARLYPRSNRFKSIAERALLRARRVFVRET